jgi:alcohol dehydrogenase class IV
MAWGPTSRPGLQRPLIVTDRRLAALPVLANSGSMAALDVAVFSGVFGNPTASQVMAGPTPSCARADCVIGFGGGATLDVAKVVGLAATHPGAHHRVRLGPPAGAADRPALPYFVALPTTSGTGSEVGRSAVISEDDTH